MREDLDLLLRRFGPGAEAAKRRQLRQLARQALPQGRSLRRYHDQLLFLRAHPDSPDLRRNAERELRRIGSALRRAKRPGLPDSGVAGTVLIGGFSLDLVRWLAARGGKDVVLDWDDESADEKLDEFLSLLVLPAEVDGLQYEGLTTREWVALARSDARGDVAWLVRRLDALAVSPRERERLFTSAGLRVRYRLRKDSRTTLRFPPRRLHYYRAPFEREVDSGTLLRQRLPAPERLGSGAVEALLDTARATLLMRHRETDPVTDANPGEVSLFRLERGVDVALCGMESSRRLPIESYFGFVAARNRVPVAYGGGWIFFGRCEIGVNIFPEFRGGESAHLFAQVMRVYRRRFRATQFLVAPFQFGAGNREAIRSGAFWFYYRLGFRPTDPRLRRLAGSEAARGRMEAGYRTPARVLRRLAEGKVYLDVGRAAGEAFVPAAPEPPELGVAVTRWVGERFGGDRERASAWALRRIERLAGIGRRGRWPEAEREWFERLAPLGAMLPELRTWPRVQVRAMVEAFRAKGGLRERDYALALQRHDLLRRSWLGLMTGE